jgi:hypothetical protein
MFKTRRHILSTTWPKVYRRSLTFCCHHLAFLSPRHPRLVGQHGHEGTRRRPCQPSLHDSHTGNANVSCSYFSTAQYSRLYRTAAAFWCLLSSCLGTSIRQLFSNLWEYLELGSRYNDTRRRGRFREDGELWEMEHRGRAG